MRPYNVSHTSICLLLCILHSIAYFVEITAKKIYIINYQQPNSISTEARESGKENECQNEEEEEENDDDEDDEQQKNRHHERANTHTLEK